MLLALFGSNEFEKDEKIAEFCQKALATGSKHKIFFASDYIHEDSSITADIAKALTPSFFEPAFSVLVRHCEYMLAEEQRRLVNFLSGLCQANESFQGNLLLDFFESDDMKFDKRSALWKFLEKQKVVELFPSPKYNAIQKWITNHVQKHFNRKIGIAAAGYIADAIGGDTKRIHNEIKKILMYDNSIQELNEQHCLLFIKQDRDIPAYELQEPFGFRNLAEFLPKFRRILAEKGDFSINITNVLRDHCLSLLHIQAMRAKKISDTEIASKILPPNRIFTYQKNKLPEQSSRWQYGSLQKTILRLDELSYGKKMGYYADLPSFELAICSLLL
jgi:DNA polymerase III delta subunit